MGTSDLLLLFIPSATIAPRSYIHEPHEPGATDTNARGEKPLRSPMEKKGWHWQGQPEQSPRSCQTDGDWADDCASLGDSRKTLVGEAEWAMVAAFRADGAGVDFGMPKER